MKPERRLWKPDVTKDVHDELSHHLEMRQREYVERGIDPSEARDIAARRFGNVQSIAAACRDIDERWYREQKRASMWMDLRQDIGYGLRVVRKSPAFLIAAVASLSIGIAATTTAFSAINAVLFRSLPGVQDSTRVAQIYTTAPWIGGGMSTEDLRRHYQAVLTSFSGVAGFRSTNLAIAIGEEPFVGRALFVSENYFDVLGTPPAAGRLIDTTVYRLPVAVVSHDLAVGHFGSTNAAIGRRIEINGQSVETIGVTPAGFGGASPGEFGAGAASRPQVWIPLEMSAVLQPPSQALMNRGMASTSVSRWIQLIGRLAPGVTWTAAKTQAATQPPVMIPGGRTPDGRLLIRPLGRGPHDNTSDIATAVTLILAVPLIVLAIGCANTANLQLARAAHRQAEIGVRRSLGATRGRIVRQLLVESAIVAAAAGVVGIAATMMLSRLLAGFMPVPFPLDWRVLAFALAIITLTGIGFGLAPAVGATRGDLTGPLKDSAGPPAFRRSRLRNSLVIAQIALSLVLLVMAGLFTRTVQRLHGFDAERGMSQVAAATIDLGYLKYSDAQIRAFQEELLARTERIPGAEAAAIVPFEPFGGSSGLTYRRPDVTYGSGRYDYTNGGAPLGRFIETAGIRVLRGRGFTGADRAGTPRVAVVSEALALRISPSGDVLGRELLVADGETPAMPVTIVGITADARLRVVTRETHAMFLPSPLAYDRSFSLWVRTTGDPAQALPHIRSIVRDMDPRLPIPRLGTAESWRDREIGPMRWIASGVGAMGLLALGLAGAGLYAVMTYLVARRRHEMAVRLALGATPLQLTALVVGDGLRLSVPGLIVGALLSALVAHLARVMLLGVSPFDPIAFGGVALVLIVVALVATLVPALRASKLDPLVTLRRQ